MMPREKLIIYVTASFEEKETLFETIKKYARHSDDKFAYWDEFAFTVNTRREYDGMLVFNTPSTEIRAKCFPEWVIAFMMEPGIQGKHPWMFNGLNQYARVLSPIHQSTNSTSSHGFLGWYFKHSWNYLNELDVPVKKSAMSCIASTLTHLKGQQVRAEFVSLLRERIPEINFFGRGLLFLPDKLDGLLPYRFSIVIENTSMNNYFTEKINDSFLAYTIPLYYGCRNLDKYFPWGSYIPIDIKQPEKAISKIEETLANNDWSDRLGALKEARHLVLNKYQPLAGAADILRGIPVSSEKRNLTIKPVQRNLEQWARYLLLKINERWRS